MISFNPKAIIRSADLNSNFQGLADGSEITNVEITAINNPYKFHAYRNGTQAITTAVWTQVQLNAEAFDSNSSFDLAVYEYTVPVNGYYQLNGQVYATASDGTYNIVQIAKNPVAGNNSSANGGTLLAEARDTMSAVSSNKVMSCSCFVYLTTSDTVGLVAYIEDTTSPTVGSGAGVTFLSGFLVSI